MKEFRIKLRSKRRNSSGAIVYKEFNVEAETKEEAIDKIEPSEMVGFKLWEVHSPFPKEILEKAEGDYFDVPMMAVFL